MYGDRTRMDKKVFWIVLLAALLAWWLISRIAQSGQDP